MSLNQIVSLQDHQAKWKLGGDLLHLLQRGELVVVVLYPQDLHEVAVLGGHEAGVDVALVNGYMVLGEPDAAESRTGQIDPAFLVVVID